jgi:hypothetical protein
MTEELIAKDSGGTSIPPHPADQYAMTCIDIVDLGMIETEWQGQKRLKHRVFFRFFGGEFFEGSDGKPRPHWVDAYFTLTLSEKGSLRPFLEAWRGQAFTEEELQGWNILRVLHAPALVQIVHNKSNERTYANIASIMRIPKGMDAPGVPEGYVRVKDRPRDEQGDGERSLSDPDDDLPF